MPENQSPRQIAPIRAPVQYVEPQFPYLVEVDEFLQVSKARRDFKVTGKGLTAAVLDTGLNTGHVDFEGRVVAQRNYTSDNGGDPDDASDGNGHGTNVGGIVVANGDHIGIAPEANIIPLKVLSNDGGGSFQAVEDALDWVMAHRDEYNITIVCMSLSDGGNYTEDLAFQYDATRLKIRQLRDLKVPVVVAAGNHYYTHDSQEGMTFPAICRECVSVGAVYDADVGPMAYWDGAEAYSTKAGQITPFSQRLHPDTNPETLTDIFAPGAPVTSSGMDGPYGESVQEGTSQATPVTAGLILLMQDFYLKSRGELPAVDDLVTWLRRGGVSIMDGDDEDDNVDHTGKYFLRADAPLALDAVRRHLYKAMLGDSGSQGGE